MYINTTAKSLAFGKSSYSDFDDTYQVCIEWDQTPSKCSVRFFLLQGGGKIICVWIKKERK
jgi:hypothetical protein